MRSLAGTCKTSLRHGGVWLNSAALQYLSALCHLDFWFL